MWIIGLFLAFPLLLGVATTGRRLYGKLRERGVEQRKATTIAFVSILLLAGVLSSPWMMPFGILRIAAGISYLYFLYVGGKSIIDFFYGGPAVEKGKGEDHVDCGCDHGDGHGHHGEHHADAHKHDDEGEDKGTGTENGAGSDDKGAGSQNQEPAAKPAKRDPREIREELKRRQQGNGSGDSK
jgi:hypothetical protein